MRWAEHAVFLRFLETKTDGKEGRSDEVDPKNFNGGQGENRMVVVILEGKANKEENNLGDVGDEKMHEEL